jgi:hypothetical protein
MGSLTSVAGSAVPTGPSVTTFQLVPHSSFAWAFSQFGPDGIYVYAVDSSTGLLTAAPGNPFQALSGVAIPPACGGWPGRSGTPSAVTLDPAGGFGYGRETAIEISNSIGNSQVWQFTIDPTTGAPILVLNSSIPAGCNSPGGTGHRSERAVRACRGDRAARLHNRNFPSGNFAFTIDATTGALTLVPGSPFFGPAVSGDSYSTRVTVDPTGRFLYALGYGISASQPRGLSGSYNEN